MRESTHRAVCARRALEIEMSERVCSTRSRRDAEVPEQRFADQMRWLAARAARAEVDAGLAEPRRLQLRMAVGDVQEADVSERLEPFVQVLAVRAIGRAARIDRQSGDGGGGESLQEFAPLHDRIIARPGGGEPRRGVALTG